MNKFLKKALFAVSLLVVAIPVIVAGVAAQDNNNQQQQPLGQGIEISPPVINLEADPGETITANIRLLNITELPLVAEGAVNDFVASGETGKPKILFDDSEPSSYSLKQYIEKVPDVKLGPKESETLEVPIKVPENASPGSHLGVIRFTATADSPESTGVALSASVGSLVLLDVSGDVNERLGVAELYAASVDEELAEEAKPSRRNYFEYGPVKIVSRLRNNGNVHVQPLGTVEVKNMLGNTVDQAKFTDSPLNVLPDSIRRFENQLGDKWMFGRYTAEINLTYGDNNKQLIGSTTFWVIPWKYLGIGLLMLLALGWGATKGIKIYNRRIIEKAKSQEMSDNPPGNTPPSSPPDNSQDANKEQ